MLADANHQLNCGAYMLRQVMLVDGSGLCTMFYIPLPNKRGTSYCHAKHAVKGRLLSMDDVQMIVAKRSLAQ